MTDVGALISQISTQLKDTKFAQEGIMLDK